MLGADAGSPSFGNIRLEPLTSSPMVDVIGIKQGDEDIHIKQCAHLTRPIRRAADR